MAACAQADILHVGSESEVDLLVHTKSRQSCARYVAAMPMIEHAKNPKEQIEHCLIMPGR